MLIDDKYIFRADYWDHNNRLVLTPILGKLPKKNCFTISKDIFCNFFIDILKNMAVTLIVSSDKNKQTFLFP